MGSKKFTHRITNLIIETSPEKVEAGSKLKVVARVSCSPALDLRGKSVVIKDHTDAIISNAEFEVFDGEINQSGEIMVNAPASVGTHIWSVICPGMSAAGLSYEEKSEPFSITVIPHATQLVVWDVPSVIVGGERFYIKVGLKCSYGCGHEGRQFVVSDAQGTHIASGAMSCEFWPGSNALQFVEVQIEAPVEVGLQEWQVNAPAERANDLGSDVKVSHEASACAFGVRLVSPPTARVRVVVRNKDKKSPLKGASVVMFPYRAVTDDHGVAKFKVAKGHYRLQVSRFEHRPFSSSVEVTDDLTVSAELSAEPLENPNEYLY